jgi:hypothetical protein
MDLAPNITFGNSIHDSMHGSNECPYMALQLRHQRGTPIHAFRIDVEILSPTKRNVMRIRLLLQPLQLKRRTLIPVSELDLTP